MMNFVTALLVLSLINTLMVENSFYKNTLTFLVAFCILLLLSTFCNIQAEKGYIFHETLKMTSSKPATQKRFKQISFFTKVSVDQISSHFMIFNTKYRKFQPKKVI